MHSDSWLLLRLSSPKARGSHQPNADWEETNAREHGLACRFPVTGDTFAPIAQFSKQGTAWVQTNCLFSTHSTSSQAKGKRRAKLASNLFQMFTCTHMNGKEPHVKFLSVPLLSPQESGYSQNHFDSLRACVSEASPQSLCTLGAVSSLDREAALHPCGDEGRSHTRLCWPEHSQHVKG